jgi:hypothetical protein
MHRTRVSFLEVLIWTFVNFWIKVSSPSLAINETLSIIRDETHEAKNQGVKPQGAKMYLTLKRKKY